jgi:hypothetical protein
MIRRKTHPTSHNYAPQTQKRPPSQNQKPAKIKTNTTKTKLQSVQVQFLRIYFGFVDGFHKLVKYSQPF